MARVMPDVARVMIVDDSPVIRSALARMLSGDPAIRVVTRAADGATALTSLAEHAIDVVILDVEMPGMDGLEVLPLLLRARPRLRVLMASVRTTRGADITLRALRLGAADYITKPSADDLSTESFRAQLLAKIKGLSASQPAAATRAPLRLTARPARPMSLLAIGSSTGGPQALFSLFQALGARIAVPVVITQHMPLSFIPILAEQLGRLGGLPCQVAEQGGRLLPGHAYMAPGERHFLIQRSGDDLVAELVDQPPEHHCRPAVDPMLRSAAVATRGRLLVIMLTGMGYDGLAGTRAVVEAGGAALAQDEASSVVWGMPGAIAQAGLCHEVAPIPALARTALSLLSPRPPPARVTEGR
jgi:two-component system chemotaxis response regulator CheB